MEDEIVDYEKKEVSPDVTANLTFLEKLVDGGIMPKPVELSLKEKLIKVLEEDPGVAKISENPWLHDVWVRKLKELVT